MKRVLRLTGILITGAITALVILGLVSDQITYTSTVDVAAPVEEVWATFMDGPRMEEWLPGFTALEVVEGDAGTVGSLHRLYFDNGSVLDERVTVVVPGERYAYDMEAALFTGSVDVTFALHNDGTRIVKTTVMRGATFHWRALLPVFKPFMQNEQMRSLDVLASLVEDDPSVPARAVDQ